MKNIYLVLLTFILITSCKKEKTQPQEPASTNASPNQPSSYKKLKTLRTVDTHTNGTIHIMNQSYAYNSSTGRPSTNIQMDSSYSSSAWTVSSFTATLSYNALGTATAYIISPSTYITYVYDTNNKLKYEISTYGSSIDTAIYTYNGNNYLKTRSTSSGGKQVDYYSMNLDSSISYNSANVPTFRNWWTYNQNLDLGWAYIKQYLLGFDLDKNELGSYSNSAGNSHTYSYTYDAQNYQVLKQYNNSFTSSQTYYTYY
jgi:hypothetical protein